MGWLSVVRNKAVPVPEGLTLERGERVLATGVADDTTVVITSRRLVVPDGDLDEGRPWHLVDGGRWDPEESVLSVSWVDGSPAGRWHLTKPGGVPDAFHERVRGHFLALAEAAPERYLVVDGAAHAQAVADRVRSHLQREGVL